MTSVVPERPADVLCDLHAEALVAPGTPLRLEGMFNLRDLGGYATHDGGRTRTGRIFRADALAHLTDRDLAALASLGLSLVCDLRSQQEVDFEVRPRIVAAERDAFVGSPADVWQR